ncbi:MAG: class I SAM-dependent methyltransferase [Bacteroidota bacterium]|nr:class I SAM-dependent methyltransferase [Bacteroidota bacterium]
MDNSNNNSISALLGRTDIYLVDQIMKERYMEGDKILDAGCGGGRNMHWFVQNNFDMYGIDSSEAAIINLRNEYPSLPSKNLQVAFIEALPFTDNFFDHVISSAVLHFAANAAHFKEMIGEMVRVMIPSGTLFIRMTSDIGIEDKVKLLPNGNHIIPDGSMRFLLTKTLLAECMQQFKISFLEPLKTVNVDDMRCMSTLMLQKK